MKKLSDLKIKFGTCTIEYLENLLVLPELVWDDEEINNRIFKEILLKSSLSNVEKILEDKRFNLNLKKIDSFFYEKLITNHTSQSLDKLNYLIDNHFIDEHINDLFVFSSFTNLVVLKKLYPFIKENSFIEQALINIIFRYNSYNYEKIYGLKPQHYPENLLENFSYLYDSFICDTNFKINLINICISRNVQDILPLILQSLSPTSVHEIFITMDIKNLDAFLLKSFIYYGANLEKLSPEEALELCCYDYFELFHFLLLEQYIIPTPELLTHFLNSDIYHLYKTDYLYEDHEAFLNEDDFEIIEQILILLNHKK